MATDISGVSRSGRVRKKSAKLLEMEELEKTETNGVASKVTHRLSTQSIIGSPISNGSVSDHNETNKTVKKKIRIRFSTNNGEGMEEMPIENSIDDYPINGITENEPTVPSLKIKLFHNGHDNSFVATPTKSTSKSVSNRKISNSDHSWSSKYDEDSAANLLFQQITSGQVNSNRKKNKRRFSPEHVDFDSDEYEDETSLMICDSSESLAAAVEKVKAAKNPIKSFTDWDEANRSKNKKNEIVVLDKDKRKKKLPAMTAYTLFTRENRHRIQQGNPGMDFASISRRLGEVWQALPAREKMQWKRRAQSYRDQAINQMSGSLSNVIRKPPAVSLVRTKPANLEPVIVKFSGTPKLMNDEQLEAALAVPVKKIGHNPADTAACFRIMGECLTTMGNKINEKAADLTNEVSLDILLDATLCSFASLLSLTTEHPSIDACDSSTHNQLLDCMSYIMPGIQ